MSAIQSRVIHRISQTMPTERINGIGKEAQVLMSGMELQFPTTSGGVRLRQNSYWWPIKKQRAGVPDAMIGLRWRISSYAGNKKPPKQIWANGADAIREVNLEGWRG